MLSLHHPSSFRDVVSWCTPSIADWSSLPLFLIAQGGGGLHVVAQQGLVLLRLVPE